MCYVCKSLLEFDTYNNKMIENPKFVQMFHMLIIKLDLPLDGKAI